MKDVPIPHVERPAYFDGQRLTAADLTDAADYSRGLRELHNRALHGWGVALGLAATGARGERAVRVAPGFALDCGGRELLLAQPRELAVPAVASHSRWYLVISGEADDELAAEQRLGVCESEGAVRLFDEPIVRWLSATRKSGVRLRDGLDVILAGAIVENCRLKEGLDLSLRQELARPQPFVAAGQTNPGATSWREWSEGGTQAGVVTTVSTTEAGFNSMPSYQARLAGDRIKGADVLDGPVRIAGASATSFDFCVDLRDFLEHANTTYDLSEIARDELGWHVVWMAVETR